MEADGGAPGVFVVFASEGNSEEQKGRENRHGSSGKTRPTQKEKGASAFRREENP